MSTLSITASVPDLSDWDGVRVWVEDRLRCLRQTSFDEPLRATFTAVDAPASFSTMLGPYGSPLWRRLAVAAFLADWACYEKPGDRVDFSRLLFVMSVFPSGFRVWMCRLPDGSFVPVGYTGWYPVSETVYESLARNDVHIDYRGLAIPWSKVGDTGNYIYLFNYSIIEALRKSRESRIMMTFLAEQIGHIPIAGMAATVVSEDGARVARRFGLEYVRDVKIDGHSQRVFATPCR
ncbi:MAG: hypothetical protein ACREC6_04855 [Hyphomicrobiaceae bacterium]